MKGKIIKEIRKCWIKEKNKFENWKIRRKCNKPGQKFKYLEISRFSKFGKLER